MKARYNAVVIGAGHNGLVAANYLAKGGFSVGVFERSDRVGGACVTNERLSRATQQVRAGHQPADRESVPSRDPPGGARAGG
jgi:flavin-dependent dehydrogenase